MYRSGNSKWKRIHWVSIKPHTNSSKHPFFSDDESYLDDNSNGPDGPDSMIPQASKVDIEKKGKKNYK